MANTEQVQTSIKEVTVDDYTFKVDTDLLDDVEAFEYVDRIENKGHIAGIVPLLKFLVGDKGYEDMKAHFAAADGKAHEGQAEYKGRFRLGKLNEVYSAIIAKFDPKD